MADNIDSERSTAEEVAQLETHAGALLSAVAVDASQDNTVELVQQLTKDVDLHQARLLPQDRDTELLNERHLADPARLIALSLIELEIGEHLLELSLSKETASRGEGMLMASARVDLRGVFDFLANRTSRRGQEMGDMAAHESNLAQLVPPALRSIPNETARTCLSIYEGLRLLPSLDISEQMSKFDPDYETLLNPFGLAVEKVGSWLSREGARLVLRGLSTLRQLLPKQAQASPWITQIRAWLEKPEGKVARILETLYGTTQRITELNERIRVAQQPPANFALAVQSIALFQENFGRAQNFLIKISSGVGHLQSLISMLPPSIQGAARPCIAIAQLLVADVAVLYGARASAINVSGLGWVPSLPAQIKRHVPPPPSPLRPTR